MGIKLASQLFIVRHEAEKDLFAVLKKLSGLGFDGVEFLGFFGKTPTEIRRQMDSLSMHAVGNHVSAEVFLANPQKLIDDHKELDCKYITIPWVGSRSAPGSAEFAESIEKLKHLAHLCRENGIIPLYHNHAHEFEGVTVMDEILDSCEELCFEPDVGWMMIKQVDPEKYLGKYMNRCPIIHIKDVYAKDWSKIGLSKELGTQKADPEKGYFEFRPTGYGMLNLPALMPLCLACNPEWLVPDHDLAYDRDSYYDLKLGLDYTRALLKICGN